MAGHSKFKNIMHRKGRQDAKRGKVFSKLIRELTVAAKVGLPDAKQGLSHKDPTIAELLKPLGYATGQFGKNHLGDRNEFLSGRAPEAVVPQKERPAASSNQLHAFQGYLLSPPGARHSILEPQTRYLPPATRPPWDPDGLH